jgi:hypothetical protein
MYEQQLIRVIACTLFRFPNPIRRMTAFFQSGKGGSNRIEGDFKTPSGTVTTATSAVKVSD